MSHTLKYEINVPVRLLIYRPLSRGYGPYFVLYIQVLMKIAVIFCGNFPFFTIFAKILLLSLIFLVQ